MTDDSSKHKLITKNKHDNVCQYSISSLTEVHELQTSQHDKSSQHEQSDKVIDVGRQVFRYKDASKGGKDPLLGCPKAFRRPSRNLFIAV